MPNPVGRPVGYPKSPDSGRKPGQKNRLQVTEAMRADILLVYRKLGGVKWLLTWAKENETLFVDKVLVRVLPPMPREEADQPPIGLQINSLTLTESAMRVAFLLSAAAHANGQDDTSVTRTIEAVPEPAPEPVNDPLALPPLAEPIEERPPTPEVWRGSAAEQARERPGRTHSVTKARRNLL